MQSGRTELSRKCTIKLADPKKSNHMDSSGATQHDPNSAELPIHFKLIFSA